MHPALVLAPLQAAALRRAFANALVQGRACEWPGLGTFEAAEHPAPGGRFLLLRFRPSPACSQALEMEHSGGSPGDPEWIRAFADQTGMTAAGAESLLASTTDSLLVSLDVRGSLATPVVAVTIRRGEGEDDDPAAGPPEFSAWPHRDVLTALNPSPVQFALAERHLVQRAQKLWPGR